MYFSRRKMNVLCFVVVFSPLRKHELTSGRTRLLSVAKEDAPATWYFRGNSRFFTPRPTVPIVILASYFNRALLTHLLHYHNLWNFGLWLASDGSNYSSHLIWPLHFWVSTISFRVTQELLRAPGLALENWNSSWHLCDIFVLHNVHLQESLIWEHMEHCRKTIKSGVRDPDFGDLPLPTH